MSEKRFRVMDNDSKQLYCIESVDGEMFSMQEIVELLNDQQSTIEELQVSDEMGWKRAERFEKKCPKQLHNKKMYIKRLEYKVQKFKEENEKLRKDLYIVQTDCKNAKESKEHWRNKAKELEEKNKQIGFLKRDLYTIIRDTKETPFGNSITMTEIRERWE